MRATPLRSKLTRVENHVATAGKIATAWYVVPPQPWAFQSEGNRDRLIRSGALRYSELVGRRIRWRSTTRPQTPEGWRARLDAQAVAPLPGWPRVLDWQAARLQGLDMAEPITYLGVDVQRRSSRWVGFALWQDATIAELDRIVAGNGWGARPATFDEIDWLVRSSVAIGHNAELPPKSDVAYEEGDMVEMGDPLWFTDTAYARSLKVAHNGAVRHVVTSVVGRMRVLDSESYGPWMTRALGLGFPVEMSATFDVKPMAEVEARVRTFMRRADSQIKHFAEHDKEPPTTTLAAERRARDVEAELDDPSDESARLYGWVRYAVSDDTEEGALAKAKEVARCFNPGITVYNPTHDQYALALEFIPGQLDGPKCRYSRRELPALTVAGGMPGAVAKIGDRNGFYQGWTTGRGGQRAAFWNPWASMEDRKGNGTTVEAGDLGAGKTFFTGANTYLAAMSGAICVLLDGSPAGLLGNLCYLPELRHKATHVDLQRSQTPGQYNPWYLVPTPRRADYDDTPTGEVQWSQACRLAEANRRSLAVDDISMMLTEAPTPAQRTALIKAAQTASRTDKPSLRVMIEALAKTDRDLSDYLVDEVALHPAAQVFFDSGTELDWTPQQDDTTLTVVTLGGVALPHEGKPRNEWSAAERFGLLQLTSAAWQVYSILYSSDRHARKWAFFDEADQLARFQMGRTLLSLPANDARKHNLRLNVATHSMVGLAAVGFDTVIDSIFGFNTSGVDAQKALLTAQHIPVDSGFEPVLAGLADRDSTPQTRDCVWYDGRLSERITIDPDMVPHHVQDVLDSTAKPTQARRVQAAEKVPA